MKDFTQLLAAGTAITMITATQAIAAPALTVTPIVGHPKIQTTVSGTGFSANEAIDVYFDTTDEILEFTDATGKFGPDKLQIPANATPGAHWITALGRKNGDGVHIAFNVRTAGPNSDSIFNTAAAIPTRT